MSQINTTKKIRSRLISKMETEILELTERLNKSHYYMIMVYAEGIIYRIK